MPARTTTMPSLLAALAATAAVPSLACAQTLTPFPRAAVGGVSEDGRYVAYSTLGDNAFRFDSLTGESLPIGRGITQDMTPDGTAIVGTKTSGDGAFLWTEDGGYVDLNATVPEFADPRTRAYAITDDASAIIGAPFFEPSFVYRLDGPTTHLPPGGEALEISGDGSTVPGWLYPPGGIYEDAAVFDAIDGAAQVLLPGCDCGSSVATRDGSLIAGFLPWQNQLFRAPAGGDVEIIDMFPDTLATFFFDMSADGGVMTGMVFRPDAAYAYIWTEDVGLRTFHDFLTFEQGFDVTGWQFEYVAVNPSGRAFAGAGYDPAGQASNFLVTLGPPCVADFDRDGSLTIFDFLAFQNLFQDGNPAADLDGDGELTLLDYLAFQNAFDAGCE